MLGDRGPAETAVIGCKGLIVENDRDRSEVGVDSSITGGALVCPLAA
jgi:hypothetical protein